MNGLCRALGLMTVSEMLDNKYSLKNDAVGFSLNRSHICLQVIRQLLKNDSIEPLPRLLLDIEDALTPDISVFTAGDVQVDFFEDASCCEVLPKIAIHIVSGQNTIAYMLDQAQKLIDGEVPWVWLIEPHTQSVFVIGEDGKMLFHRDVVETAGIEVDFDEVFTIQELSE